MNASSTLLGSPRLFNIVFLTLALGIGKVIVLKKGLGLGLGERV